jgi:hypothetical protein
MLNYTVKNKITRRGRNTQTSRRICASKSRFGFLDLCRVASGFIPRALDEGITEGLLPVCSVLLYPGRSFNLVHLEEEIVKERLAGGQHCLRREEEEPLYSLKDGELEQEMRKLLPILVVAKLTQMGELAQVLRSFNSLLWIYIQRPEVLERVVCNIHLLWVLAGIPSINQFAQKVNLNPSFAGRLLDGDPTGIGGWNLHNVTKIAGVLKVVPEELLFANFGAILRQAAGIEGAS